MKRSARRVAVEPSQARAKSDIFTFPAPVRGWVSSENLAAARPASALVLENWFPTQTGIRLRGGSLLFATLEDPVESLFPYVAGGTRKLFGATETAIYDITSPADPETPPTPAVENQTAGRYGTVQFETVGGSFLYALNAADAARLFDGSDWWKVEEDALFDLPYDAETGAFTVGLTVTGGMSGATAEIVAIDDQGTTGVLTVKDVANGPFQDNETITDGGTGSATSDIPDGLIDVQPYAIAGVSTDALSYGWVWGNRIWFVEEGTKNAWYLGVDSIAGTATKFSLSGVFQRGGSLMFGASWSVDSGEGLDDYNVFVSTEGEVVVYQGTDPASASTFSKVGVYDITRPLGKNAHMRAGGDLLIATETGLVPLSEAFKRDVAALSLAAVSRNIQDDWRRDAALRSTKPWHVVKWPTFNMAIIGTPVIDTSTDPYCFVVNLETGAWAKYTGWDVESVALHDGRAYFGTSDGSVLLAEVGGSDNGVAYVSKYVGAFDHLRSVGLTKTVNLVRATFRYAQPFNPQVSASTDYAITLPAAPIAAENDSGDLWDVGNWDEALWSASLVETVRTDWYSIGVTGFVAAPQIQVTNGSAANPSAELVSFDAIYQVGGTVV